MRYVLAGSLVSLVLCPLLVHPVGLGLAGSAIANVAGQAVTAACSSGRWPARASPGGRGRPPSRAQLVIGRDLLLRAAVLQLSFLVAAGVAARAGTAALGAHQIALQLFFFLALVLDAYAIAAQTLVGQALGGEPAGRGPGHRPPGRPLGAGHRAGRRRRSCSRCATSCSPLFTDDPAVLAQAEVVWWFLAGMQPLAGVVFALDGVLMGAGDVGYLRTVTIGSARRSASCRCRCWPLPLGWGLAGVWTGLCLFIGLRLVGVLARVAGDRWLSGACDSYRVSPKQPDADVPPGLLLVDKPGGMTSHDVVARARRVLSVRKVGHAGTLDPMATGLLILGVGAATRLLGYVGGHDKTYEATIRLGQSTVTDDREGEVLTTASTAHLDDDAIRAALAAQTGPLQQVPSSVSAVKVDGRRSYDRVRAGEAVELAPRSVTVHRLEVHRIERPDARPGRRRRHRRPARPAPTSARSPATPAPRSASGGHLTALRRTASGPFAVDAGRAGRGGRGRAARRRRSGLPAARRRRDHGLPGAGAHRRRGPRAVLRPADPGDRRARPARRRRPRRPAGRPGRGRRRRPPGWPSASRPA